MTSKNFNKKVSKICSLYGFEQINKDEYSGQTPFGELIIKSSPSPRLKIYTVFMKFKNDFDINDFFKYFSKNETINKFSKKWNIHDLDCDYVLNELDERLNNLNYILKK